MATVEEVYLIQKLKEGDIDAFEAIFNKHYSNLCNYLFLLFKNQFLVEHIAQDIFIYIWENRKNIEIKTSLESYLYTAGKYKALNQVRDAKRHEKILEEITNEQEKLARQSDKIVEQKELEQIIEEAITKLPKRCQEIFRLSKEEQMNYKEIAQFLQISVNTVENQMSIALKKLRKKLRPFYIQIWVIA